MKRLAHAMDDDQMQYFYCSNCARLSPAMGDQFDDLICLVCGLNMDLSRIGRQVLFTRDEALIRNLPWRTH